MFAQIPTNAVKARKVNENGRHPHHPWTRKKERGNWIYFFLNLDCAPELHQLLINWNFSVPFKTRYTGHRKKSKVHSYFKLIIEVVELPAKVERQQLPKRRRIWRVTWRILLLNPTSLKYKYPNPVSKVIMILANKLKFLWVVCVEKGEFSKTVKRTSTESLHQKLICILRPCSSKQFIY